MNSILNQIGDIICPGKLWTDSLSINIDDNCEDTPGKTCGQCSGYCACKQECVCPSDCDDNDVSKQNNRNG